MDRLTAIRVFVRVADTGSLTVTAAKLDMSRAMVSRYLNEVEVWLGARLFHRSTRRVSLTEAGSEALIRCRQMLTLVEETEAAINTSDNAPHGLIRVTSSVSFAQTCLSAALTAYAARYPETKVDILAVDRTVNLVEERVDLAVRITNELDPNLIARKLGVCQSVVCATPAYLKRHGAPAEPQDLASHNCLTYSYFGKSLWNFTRGEEKFTVPVCGNVSANEVMVITQAVLADGGIAMQPTYSVGPLIRSGRLVALLPDFQPNEMGIYAVYASRRHMPATLRTLLDFLAEHFEAIGDWETACAP